MSRPVVVVVGNPRAGSRTAAAAAALGRRVAGDGEVRVVELADLAGELFDPSSPGVAAAVEAVREAAALVVASPTYKATYTGLLKAFLDRFGADALLGIPTVPLMVAGAPHHALAVETSLRPVLVEIGASMPTRGVFVLDADLADPDAALEAWCATHLAVLRPALAARRAG
ncbi:NADPH-dependent FMN reductase [Georgenia thermotolerans]|uniref:NADPH-dependent oxidoreductase n=1 Tax=Georgenia thermotolerans TaxID=527326 RepID=A0A7J5UUZ8_9MICO|nr:NAD(P)H-dependent oxidoreductase [Georgenia thermotolerans]KAE8766093.1 NADPH-dependent oxidoreductase [Georgenia thermotolerans]